MGKEIERRFLAKGDAWRSLAEGVSFRQGFLSTVKERVVRVRVAGGKGTLTVKGITTGYSKAEFEYEIPREEAERMLDELCERPLIEKQRFRIDHAGLTWEVDAFEGENAGLVIAEVELESEDQAVELPEWIDREISDDPRYFNSNLVQAPYSTWKDQA
ncbi:MAG: CYTH domain-containing protein [Magnetococcales bacterium]|nr:CYTH domain-containing protein [Magnetococcales bacterium]